MRVLSLHPFFIMKYPILAAITLTIAGIAAGADTTPPKNATPPKTAAKTVPQKKTVTATPQKTVTTKGTPPKTGVRTTANRRYTARTPVRRTVAPQQVSPSSDRYREIQDALASKGYLKTPSNGVWDKDSMDAMQRFQQDQKLEPTGKLTARSLSALGLGPKTPAVTAGMPAGGESSPVQ